MDGTFNTSLESSVYEALLIEEFHDVTSSSTYPLSDYSILITDPDIRQRIDLSNIGFLERDTFNRIPNNVLSLILTLTIFDRM